MMKVNLGCGSNRLKGWSNYDSEVDIAKPLPFADATVDFILCEHCMEHIAQYEAINFLKECRRVIKENGVARIIVPSLEQIQQRATPEYFKFSMKYRDCGLGPTLRGACDNIIYAFGHKAVWTASLLKAVMAYCGFDPVMECISGRSGYPELCGVDGHGKVIGDEFNRMESVIVEGTVGKGEKG